jgi:signal transduction histidine kinase
MSPDNPLARLNGMWSVRGRITLVSATIVALTVLTVGVLLLRAEEAAATANLDEVLSDEAESIRTAMTDGDAVPSLFDDDRVLLVQGPTGEIEAFQGSVADLFDVDVQTPDDHGVTLRLDGEHHRVVAERYTTSAGVGTILLAEPLDEATASIEELRYLLLIVLPIALVLLTIVIWWLAGWALRPVNGMAIDAASVGVADLDQRIGTPPGRDATARLAHELNEMLTRLGGSIRRQQRFVADASHELRTPLARMRAELEADARQPDDVDPAATRESLLEEIGLLQQVVDDMLMLVRSDLGMALDRETVDLDDLLLDEIRARRGFAAATIDAGEVSAAQVEGSASELRRVIRNLLDNSLRHAATTVRVSLSEVDGRAVLVVEDDGPGIPAEWRDVVFERFRTVRTDAHDSPGIGLGLSIVAEIVERHDGQVTIEDSSLGGARVVATLPMFQR